MRRPSLPIAPSPSELLLPRSALSLDPMNESTPLGVAAADASLASLRAAWVSAAAALAGDGAAENEDASVNSWRGAGAWRDAAARAAALLERALAAAGAAAAGGAERTAASDAARDAFNVLLAAAADPLAANASRVEDDGTLPGAAEVEEVRRGSR